MRPLPLAPLALLALSACAPYGLVKPDPPPIQALAVPPIGLGQVCVLRPHWISAAVTIAVRDNGNLVGATRGPTYFCYFAEPGVHHIRSEIADPGALETPRDASLVVDAGHRYFLEQSVHMFGHMLEWVDESRALEMVQQCGYRVVASGPAGQRVPGPTPIAGALRTAPR